VLDVQVPVVEGVVGVGRVPGGEHRGGARPEVLVGADAAVYGDAGPPGKVGSWLDADGYHDEVGLDGAAVTAPHSPDRPFAVEGSHRSSDELHAAFSVQVAVDSPDLGTQSPGEQDVLLHQDRHL
jgi:hypothetical protein